MPAGTVSATVSDSIYIVSMLLLLSALLRPVSLLYAGATKEYAVELSSSLARQIDALSPGMRSAILVPPSAALRVRLSLSGYSVSATVGGESASARERWLLPNMVIDPGEYTVSLSGSVVEIAQARVG